MKKILHIVPLGTPWRTLDPFLFCMHHDDRYPAGNERMGPAASLAGRDIGQDFSGKDGWSMYHGSVVPGFPQHPHRGFETVTIVRRGMLDHFDSLGGAGRYGGGDVQWLTAGKGILHAEMFPLLDRDNPNPGELFQIWLNLPRADKMADPHYAMFWREDLPKRIFTDASGGGTEVIVTAGSFGDAAALAPPPRSWASRPESDLAIWTIRLSPGARWTLPAGRKGVNRMLYFFRGKDLRMAGESIPASHSVEPPQEPEIELEAGASGAELLLLQGRPIGEPVVQYGPFVMNSREEIERTFEEFRRTRFGGWPWPQDDPVHPRGEGRFARLIDGRIERPGMSGKTAAIPAR